MTTKLFWRFLSWVRHPVSANAGAPAAATHLRTGRRGERLAARRLRRAPHRYRILYRNYRPRHGGEIDLVCRDGSVLVFVEVKTRTGQGFGPPAAAVDQTKRHRLVQGAQQWLNLLDDPAVQFRFDVVEVVLLSGSAPQIRVIPDAFRWSGREPGR